MKNENEQQLHQVEISLQNATKAIELGDALERLHKNSDFKKVILEDFFKEEASRAVMLKSDSNMLGEEQQITVDNIITSIGGLYQYFAKIYRIADMSIRALEANQQTREELLKEGLTEDEL